MNQDLIDIALVLTSIIIAAIVTKSMRRRKAGPGFSILLLFPPLLVFLNMWAHIVAVMAINVKRYVAGSFHYNFTVYSHLLFGIVFILLSGAAIHCTKSYLLGNRDQNRFIYLLNSATVVLFLPVGFSNPIGFLPVLAAMFSSIVLLVYQPYKKVKPMKPKRDFCQDKCILLGPVKQQTYNPKQYTQSEGLCIKKAIASGWPFLV